MAVEVETVGAAEALWTSKDIILGLGTGVVAGLAGYFGAFLKKDAEIKALSKNINDLKDQQVILTNATEQVKQDIEHQVWRKKELEQLKRQKLEEYYTKIDSASDYMLKRYTYTAHSNSQSDPEEDVFKTACLIQQLYLPELVGEHSEIIAKYSLFTDFMCEVAGFVVDYGHVDPVQNSIFLERFSAIRDVILPVVANAQLKIAEEVQKFNSFGEQPKLHHQEPKTSTLPLSQPS